MLESAARPRSLLLFLGDQSHARRPPAVRALVEPDTPAKGASVLTRTGHLHPLRDRFARKIRSRNERPIIRERNLQPIGLSDSLFDVRKTRPTTSNAWTFSQSSIDKSSSFGTLRCHDLIVGPSPEESLFRTSGTPRSRRPARHAADAIAGPRISFFGSGGLHRSPSTGSAQLEASFDHATMRQIKRAGPGRAHSTFLLAKSRIENVGDRHIWGIGWPAHCKRLSEKAYSALSLVTRAATHLRRSF